MLFVWVRFSNNLFKNHLILYINSLRPSVTSVTELGSVTEGRPGPARHSRTSTDQARRAGCRAGSVTEGRPAFWSPARVERARPFSGSQHGRSVAWRRSAVLLQAREEEEEDRREKRREERDLEEERCAAASERKGGGGQKREEKRRREEKSVAWRRSAVLLQTREEEEEDRGEKIRREERS